MKNSIKSIFPENIRTVAVTAPAGAADSGKLADALALAGSMVKIKNYIPDKSVDVPSYLAAHASERVKLFNAAVNDPEVDLIMCTRGGFGSMHLLDKIDYETLRKRNLPVMGYSDITAIHCAMAAQKAGVPVAGAMLLTLQNALADDFTVSTHLKALAAESDAAQTISVQELHDLTPTVGKGPVKARAYAANLTVLTALCGTEYMPDFTGRILILEDINEPVYKIDRMLTQLRMAGVLNNLQALIFGKFTGQDTDQQLLKALLEKTAQNMQCRCFSNFCFGHTFPMHAINSAKELCIEM